MKIIPLILSGGSGTRLWPLSRRQYPKQYLPLFGEKTMLQETCLRLNGLDDLAAPLVICNNDHRFLVAEQLQQIGLNDATILLEPIGRNTAPAIAVGAFEASKIDPDCGILVLPADHIIGDVGSFHQAIKVAIEQARCGKLVTFGITPDVANINYGYIKKGEAQGKSEAFAVAEFKEKPDLTTAKNYLNDGGYLWNSGMFLFKAETLFAELGQHCEPILAAAKKSFEQSKNDFDFIRLDKKSFEASPDTSIDYALMEKSQLSVVVPLDAAWNDLGSWAVLDEATKKDDAGNAIFGRAITIDTKNTYIYAKHHLVASIGIEDLIIVDTPDAMLIAAKDKVGEVKEIVRLLREKSAAEADNHRKVYRPWGWYDVIEAGDFFQVKKLFVKPGAKLSLQLHHKRCEHWVVVQGQASVVNGDENLTLSKGQSTYIPVETRHSLANNTTSPLEIIEVQSGSYLGEDDIERFEDIYGRVKKTGENLK